MAAAAVQTGDRTAAPKAGGHELKSGRGAKVAPTWMQLRHSPEKTVSLPAPKGQNGPPKAPTASSLLQAASPCMLTKAVQLYHL